MEKIKAFKLLPFVTIWASFLIMFSACASGTKLTEEEAAIIKAQYQLTEKAVNDRNFVFQATTDGHSMGINPDLNFVAIKGDEFQIQQDIRKRLAYSKNAPSGGYYVTGKITRYQVEEKKNGNKEIIIYGLTNSGVEQVSIKIYMFNNSRNAKLSYLFTRLPYGTIHVDQNGVLLPTGESTVQSRLQFF